MTWTLFLLLAATVLLALAAFKAATRFVDLGWLGVAFFVVAFTWPHLVAAVTS